MGNKHDQFEAFILERLAKGVMKSQISRDLVDLGVRSTPDQLSRFLKRRAERIQRNAVLVDPLRTVQPMVQTTLDETNTGSKIVAQEDSGPAASPTPPKAPTLGSRTMKPIGDFRKRGTFNIDIGNEEDLIAERKRQDHLGLLSNKLPE